MRARGLDLETDTSNIYGSPSEVSLEPGYEATSEVYVTARMERKSALQGSGLVRTVGPCAQALMPRAIATARDTFCRSNDRCESAAHFERLAC